MLQSSKKQVTHSVTCNGESNVLTHLVNNKITKLPPYSELYCKQQNKEVVKDIGTCAKNDKGKAAGTLVRVGWQTDLKDLLPIYDVCFDKVNMRNYYSKNVIPGLSIVAKYKSKRLDNWNVADYKRYFGRIRVNETYTKKNESQTMLKILGNQATVDKYFNFNSGDLFFSRGHLAANSDFVDKASQESTFNFINAAVNKHIQII